MTSTDGYNVTPALFRDLTQVNILNPEVQTCRMAFNTSSINFPKLMIPSINVEC